MYSSSRTVLASLLIAPTIWTGIVQAESSTADEFSSSADLQLKSVAVTFQSELDLLVFEQTVSGVAGATKPAPAGQLDGAPVLAYVFRTTLKPTDIGFDSIEGLVALAAVSHPDFDDTPLWDENNDKSFDNDGSVYHAHWVVLVEDDRVPGGLAAKALEEGAQVPKTHPGMPIYLDSPGFPVVLKGKTLRILIPASRVNNRSDFGYDGLTAFLQVSQSDRLPMLGVHKVYSSVAKESVAALKVQDE